jgi:hypothetical protein
LRIQARRGRAVLRLTGTDILFGYMFVADYSLVTLRKSQVRLLSNEFVFDIDFMQAEAPVENLS